MVAKSYQGLKELSAPYKHNGKMYITIETKSGNCKDVRWYTEAEYAKLYPNDKFEKAASEYYKTQKYILGFDKGYITIFSGVKPEHEEWFERSICRFARYWGWYVISTEEVPADLPNGVKPVRLDWAPMDNGKEWLKDEAAVKMHVQNTLIDSVREAKTATSKQQGTIGERLELNLHIIAKSEVEDKRYHTTTYTYTMEDSNGNRYEWKTAAKNWDFDTKHHIRGTVKEYKGTADYIITVLTRCMEV